MVPVFFVQGEKRAASPRFTARRPTISVATEMRFLIALCAAREQPLLDSGAELENAHQSNDLVQGIFDDPLGLRGLLALAEICRTTRFLR